MIEKTKIYRVLLLGLLWVPHAAQCEEGASRSFAQSSEVSRPFVHSSEDSTLVLFRDYQFVKRQDAWLATPNAAALTRYQSASIAQAELLLTHQKGGLADYYESPNTLQATAAVESFHRLNARTVVFGSISYDNYSGRDMTGSAFMHIGGHYPFDLVEDSLTNPGRKHCDTYRLTGAVGTDLYKGYSVGLRLDYIAANYAKYRDLRHKNKLMDLTFTAGLYAPVLPWLSVGADYQYHRQTESLQFSTYGKNDKVFKTLIDYGAFFGRVEQFGNEGFTDKSREMPLFEDGHGGSLQIGFQSLPSTHGEPPRLSILATAALSHGTGYYGRRSPYTITYTGHDRDRAALTLSAAYQPVSRTSRHCLDLAYTNEQLANRAETFRELTNDAGATYYEYYDPVETADKEWHDLSVAYTADLGIRGELPTWTFRATYQRAERKQTAYLYPYYRRQQLTTHDISATATRNLICHGGVWSLSLNMGFRQGSGDPFQDYTFVTPSDRQEPPATMDAFLSREYLYLTAPQYTLGGSAQYAFLLPGTRLRTHARLSVSHCKANATSDDAVGRDRLTLSATLGCTF